MKADSELKSISARVGQGLLCILTSVGGLVFASIYFGGLGALPILQFIPLGFLLAIQRRVVLSGQGTTSVVRDSFDADFSTAFAIGRRVLRWLVVLSPVVFLQWLAKRGELADPAASSFHSIGRMLPLLWLLAVTHLAVSEMRGGGRHFLEPIAGLRWLMQQRLQDWGNTLRRGRIAVCNGVLWHYRAFMRGVRGFIAVGSWLWPSAALIYLGFNNTLCEVIGAVLLAATVPMAALASVRFAVEDRIVAAWNAPDLLRRVARAPWAMAGALLFLDILTLPLYWPTYEQPAVDTAWALDTLAFLLILPTKALTAWCYRQSECAKPAILARVLSIPAYLLIVIACAAYSAVVCLAPGWSWLGKRVFLDQHAFMLPNLH